MSLDPEVPQINWDRSINSAGYFREGNIDAPFDNWTDPKGGGGGGATHYHPFKFVDASTTDPVVTKAALVAQSSLYTALYPTISETTVTALTTPITLTSTTKIWLKVFVGTGLTITSAEISIVDPSPEANRVFFNTATPPVQTGFWVLLAYVSTGADPTAPGYDFKISTTDYHLHQVCFTHLRTEIRVENGKPFIYAYPFVG